MARISWHAVQKLVSEALEEAVTAAAGAFKSEHVGEPDRSGTSVRVSVGGKGHASVRRDAEPDFAELRVHCILEVSEALASELSIFALLDYVLEQTAKETLYDDDGSGNRVHEVHILEYDYDPPTAGGMDAEKKLVRVELRLSGDVSRMSGTSRDGNVE